MWREVQGDHTIPGGTPPPKQLDEGLHGVTSLVDQQTQEHLAHIAGTVNFVHIGELLRLMWREVRGEHGPKQFTPAHGVVILDLCFVCRSSCRHAPLSSKVITEVYCRLKAFLICLLCLLFLLMPSCPT